MKPGNPENNVDNVLLLALIISICLHFAVLYSRIDWTVHNVTSAGVANSPPSPIEIPIEFIPMQVENATKMAVPDEMVRSIVDAATREHSDIKPRSQATGHYSFLRQQTLLKRYLNSVREEIETHKYGTVANRTALAGNVTVEFQILSNGAFRRVKLLNTSGSSLLDRAAVTAVRRSSGKVKRSQTTGSRIITTTAIIKYQFGL